MPGKWQKAIVKGITGTDVVDETSNTTPAANIATVADFEKWLNNYLHIYLPIDGKFDANDKRAAITAFQKIGGNIIANGIWDETSNLIANKSKTHIRLGSTGDLVKLLQGMLIVNGIYFGELHGIFDLNTTNTVLHFQKYWNLNRHGIAGTQVWKKLFG